MAFLVKCFIAASQSFTLIFYVASYLAELAWTQLLMYKLPKIINGLTIAALAEIITDFLPTVITTVAA